jgi:hypothetical protein
MKTYLDNTRFAAKSLIDAFWGDVAALNAKIREYNAAKNSLPAPGDRVVTAQNFHEAQSIAETFQKIRSLGIQINLSSAEIANRKAATDALCGALLQLGKQGLSTAYAGPMPSTPPGPMIGSQSMAMVVWQGRNQAMHWEESTPFKPKVIACFAALDADLKLSLSPDLKTRSLATAVIDILQWTTLAKYEADMLSMG